MAEGHRLHTMGVNSLIISSFPSVLFLVCWCFQRTLVPSFFLSIFCLFCISPNYIWLISSNSSTTTTMSSTTTACARVSTSVFGCVGVCVCVRGYARLCVGMRRGEQCGQVCIGVHWCAQVCVKVCGCLRVCAWDEFSECLLENRVPTSADFNTYPIRIFMNYFLSLESTIGLKEFPFLSFNHLDNRKESLLVIPIMKNTISSWEIMDIWREKFFFFGSDSDSSIKIEWHIFFLAVEQRI